MGEISGAARKDGWIAGPLLIAIRAFVAPLVSRGMIMRMIPFLSLLMIWIGAVCVMRVFEERELERLRL